MKGIYNNRIYKDRKDKLHSFRLSLTSRQIDKIIHDDNLYEKHLNLLEMNKKQEFKKLDLFYK